MKRKFCLAAVSGFLFILLIVMLKTFDVAAIGPCGTSIGFSHLNQSVHAFCGVNLLWYEITDYLGFVALSVAALFAALGLFQWWKRRSLKKVDAEIFALGGLYVVMMAFYVLFEIVIINYRPILMPECDMPEASFPSSHTMLVCVILGSAILLVQKYAKTHRLALSIACGVILSVTVVGRLICGVHWFTDILGGILMSTMLLSLYSAVWESIQLRRYVRLGNWLQENGSEQVTLSSAELETIAQLTLPLCEKEVQNYGYRMESVSEQSVTFLANH